jgi:DNA glycosylase AlkZ-like
MLAHVRLPFAVASCTRQGTLATCDITAEPGAASPIVTKQLSLTRTQILAFRRHVQALDLRLPPGPESLRRAAWAGLQDSMPRAALLSIHARVEGTEPSTWEDPSLVQVWGPRFSVYVIPRPDVALFTLGRYPDDARGRRVAEEMAASMGDVLGDRRLPDREVSRTLGVGNGIRYAAPTGTVLIRWEGARAPTIWTVPRPHVEPRDARLELARRFLHVFGPTTPTSFSRWAGIGPAGGQAAFDALGSDLTPVRTPLGEEWILAADESAFRAPAGPRAAARLLPSGDTYYLLQGADRELLVQEADRRADLWTSRVWPGAMLVSGEIAGTWRRAGPNVTIRSWRRLTADERAAVEAEASSLPLPDLRSAMRVTWEA